MDKKPNSEFLYQYGVKEKNVSFIGGFVNYVYNVKLENKDFILRIGSKKNKKLSDIEGEIDWINFLKNKEISVCAPIKNLKDNFFVESKDEIAVLFEKAEGEFVDYKSKFWNKDLFYIWGKNIGKMNNAAKYYIPDSSIKRYEWYQDVFFTPEIVKDSNFEKLFYEKMEFLKSYDKDEKSYGLIHGDLHHKNFTFNGEKMYMFDFDDSSYNYYVHDIAMPIFYSLSMFNDINEDTRFEKCEEFFIPFMKGYYEENDLDNKWLEIIPDIFKFRELLLILAINKQIDLEDPKNEKLKKYEQELKESVMLDKPYVKDFDKIIKKIKEIK